MANQLYSIARQKYLTGGANWLLESTAMMLLDANYVFDEAHTVVADLTPAARAAALPISGQLAVDGFAIGGGGLFIGLSWPVPITQVVLFDENPGDLEASELMVFYDVVDGFPLAANGGNYQILPDLAFGGYFRL